MTMPAAWEVACLRATGQTLFAAAAIAWRLLTCAVYAFQTGSYSRPVRRIALQQRGAVRTYDRGCARCWRRSRGALDS